MPRDPIIIVTPAASPFFNMAADEYLFDEVRGSSFAPAVIRIYGWTPPGITIGYNQPLYRALNPSLPTVPVPVIRRITGGRAIYHETTEVTFSLIASIGLLTAQTNSIAAVNSLISSLLVDILRRLGIDASWSRNSTRHRPDLSESAAGACFQSITRFELTAGGFKIAGGAQRRRGDFFIHQGSIKINGMTSFPAIAQPAQPPVLPPGITGPVTPDVLLTHFLAVFASQLSLNFVEYSFSSSELAQIEQLCANLANNPLQKR